jgi:saccharopine dehydrogenase-like NADP-dependent oxidoreductase
MAMERLSQGFSHPLLKVRRHWDVSSVAGRVMQRTVAYPMSIGAQMIMDGRLSKRGIVEPSEVPFEPFVTELRKRGLEITRKVEPWDGNIEPGD